MQVVVDGYVHRKGEHCASTALRNILAFHGLSLSEGMVFGLASGLGFFYIANDSLSPTRMFHGRTATLEIDFTTNTGIVHSNGMTTDDDKAWSDLRARLDEGIPVMLSTDTFYLGYQNTTSHFPKHRAVAVGYDEAAGTVLIADRKLDDYQAVPREELRRARNAGDYPISCGNEYDHFSGQLELGRSLPESIRYAIVRNVRGMRAEADASIPMATVGFAGMRRLAAEFRSWKSIDDWSWAARFGYQVVIKRGAGDHFFRSLYADFLRESSEAVPALAEYGLGERMDVIAERWVDFASVLKEQSERETCEPGLFEAAGHRMLELADLEEALFDRLGELCLRDALWTG
ncbi:MAG: DUF4872 domain-containing protein [Deltaproteobacteria bacterium]|nr:DUF4872 domain-containing protein [Deltaproteobacteria bacterium]